MDGKRALISDIHSNIEALTAVFEDIAAQGISEIYCLGDVVGYGPDPIECVDLIRKKCKVCLCGNHDLAVITNLPFGFNEPARKAVDWTHKVMKPWSLSFPSTQARWNFLRELSEKFLKLEEGDLLYVHASPRDTVMEYLEESDCEDTGMGPSGKIIDNLALVKWLAFNGHTHRPGIITEDFHFIRQADVTGPYEFKSGEKSIVNVGSVGQPRDGNPHACYAVLSAVGGKYTLEYRRVKYDCEKTAEKIRRNPDLDVRSAERLITGS